MMPGVLREKSIVQEMSSHDMKLPLPTTTDIPTNSREPKLLSKRTLCVVAAICFTLGHLSLWHPANSDSRSTRRDLPGRNNPAYLIRARHGAVAAENKRCSDIGVDALKDGGNAVDAAIAATFCTGVVNMFSSGIGGGGFMTVRIPPAKAGDSSEVFTINFRETGPRGANTTMYVDDPLKARWGGLSVGVPGEVRGLEEAHRRWSKLSWGRLIQPSIDLAAGWKVDRELGRRIPWFSDVIFNSSDWSSIFAPKGVLLKEGDQIRRTNLSRTLSTIAKEGANAFYNGPIADALVRKIRSTGGVMTQEDLRNYTVQVDRALEGTYRGRKVYTTHAPGAGPVLLHMLNLIERFDVKELDVTTSHRIVETMKFGFAARTKVCDPAFGNNTQRMAIIPTKQYADVIAKNITDDRTHTPDYYNPEYDVKIDHGTSHTSVVDSNGMSVAITSTVNQVFGSLVMDPETGVLLNDEMDDFSTPGAPNGFGLWPSPYNYPEAGKRPLSSTAPTIMENSDGSFYLAMGASGGGRIFPAMFQVILNLERGMDISSAIEFGRLQDQLYPLVLDVDNVYPLENINGLRELGHNVTVRDINRVAAVVQAVIQDGGMIYAASDSRKNGIAAGY